MLEYGWKRDFTRKKVMTSIFLLWTFHLYVATFQYHQIPQKHALSQVKGEDTDCNSYTTLKSTCDVNLLSKLSIIFKEWRVMNNVDRGGVIVLFIL